MLTTSRFSLDVATIAENAILTGITSGDRARVVTVVQEFQATDVVVQAVFTAKVSKADADDAPTTIQKILPSPDGVIQDVYGDGKTYRFIFELEEVDTTALLTKRFYDVRLWVERDGSEFPRTVQRGTIVAVEGVTSTETVVPVLALEAGGFLRLIGA